MLYLAYTREDALFTVQLAEDLGNLGIDVWLDLNEIAPGADWATSQQAAIEASEGLIVILSPEAMQRDHMRREIEQAFARRKVILLAVARRSPWRDWLNDLPVADFTENYETGLDSLVLNIMGDTPETNELLDEAERWLQQATVPQDSEEADQPRRSFISRLLRRD